ncbi:MAG: hypothetical protein NDI84_12125 [Steroidobacteraceae bacterium]|nr:hypothetical protein [Steroidobacteraceae bacterium]
MASWQRPCSSQPAHRTDRSWPALLPILALLCGGCGRADDRADDRTDTRAAATDAGCIPAATSSLRARLRGSIEAEIDWGQAGPYCLGGVRPQGDGLRLVYKGSVPDTGPLLLVFGIAPLRPGESARNVPVNVTVVREGTGQFFATQGEDKCALDAVTQVPVDGEPRQYRLEGRGYCSQPARAVGGEGAVLLSRFDVVAIVPASADTGTSGQPATQATP